MSSLETLLAVERKRIWWRGGAIIAATMSVGLSLIVALVAATSKHADDTGPVVIGALVGLCIYVLMMYGAGAGASVMRASSTIKKGASDHVGHLPFVHVFIRMPTFRLCKNGGAELVSPARVQFTFVGRKRAA